MTFVLSTCWEMRNDYADSHPEITSIRSLGEAHSSVTPGQDAKRTQPGELGEQGKSASERLTSIYDAHSQRGPCRQSLVCGAPRRCPSYVQQYNYTLNVGTYLGASAREGRRLGSVHQRVIASSTSGVPTCHASGYAHQRC